ncbi:MAG: uroporphyrinogen-III C-methyltransferase [Bacteroidia bacterium]|nr:uroporphyrinogen-III C-methyltransferase [Bacteroidia bacterium]
MKKNIVHKPKLYIVGAGPGDPELITFKALRILKNADVVFYDALIDPQLLDFTKTDCIKIFTGKRKNRHAFTQEQIHELILHYSQKYGTLVRLKGGDPFVFGRGFEEIQFASDNGIETEYVPGISSAIAVPGIFGIPLTARGISNNFTVITATSGKGELTSNIRKAIQASGTLVILMGLNKIHDILKIYELLNKHDTPVAVLQNGTFKNQKMIYGTVSTIRKKIHELVPEWPSIIITGDVVKAGMDILKKKKLPRQQKTLELL